MLEDATGWCHSGILESEGCNSRVFNLPPESWVAFSAKHVGGRVCLGDEPLGKRTTLGYAGLTPPCLGGRKKVRRNLASFSILLGCRRRVGRPMGYYSGSAWSSVGPGRRHPFEGSEPTSWYTVDLSGVSTKQRLSRPLLGPLPPNHLVTSDGANQLKGCLIRLDWTRASEHLFTAPKLDPVTESFPRTAGSSRVASEVNRNPSSTSSHCIVVYRVFCGSIHTTISS